MKKQTSSAPAEHAASAPHLLLRLRRLHARATAGAPEDTFQQVRQLWCHCNAFRDRSLQVMLWLLECILVVTSRTEAMDVCTPAAAAVIDLVARCAGNGEKELCRMFNLNACDAQLVSGRAAKVLRALMRCEGGQSRVVNIGVSSILHASDWTEPTRFMLTQHLKSAAVCFSLAEEREVNREQLAHLAHRCFELCRGHRVQNDLETATGKVDSVGHLLTGDNGPRLVRVCACTCLRASLFCFPDHVWGWLPRVAGSVSENLAGAVDHLCRALLGSDVYLVRALVLLGRLWRRMVRSGVEAQGQKLLHPVRLLANFEAVAGCGDITGMLMSLLIDPQTGCQLLEHMCIVGRTLKKLSPDVFRRDQRMVNGLKLIGRFRKSLVRASTVGALPFDVAPLVRALGAGS